MDGVGYVCALVLAVVFVWAAAAKLAHPALTAAGFTAMRIPGPGVLARAVPAAELLTAVLLLVLPRLGAAVALVLLAVFTAVILRALRLGLTAVCACFGAGSTKPVSKAHVVRNLVLAALAVVSAAS